MLGALADQHLVGIADNESGNNLFHRPETVQLSETFTLTDINKGAERLS
jgi:hypothetical protein